MQDPTPLLQVAPVVRAAVGSDGRQQLPDARRAAARHQRTVVEQARRLEPFDDGSVRILSRRVRVALCD